MSDHKHVEESGCVIRIVQDDEPMNPREWDNLGTILYTSTRYTLGDKQVPGHEIKEITERDDVIWLPVYAYIHSGIALSTSGFSCPWDSGMCGIIYVETETARKEWGDDFSEEKVKQCLQAEIKAFDQYLAGDIYGYIVEKSGEHVGSCWGFYGDPGIEDAISQAREVAKFEKEEAEWAACQT